MLTVGAGCVIGFGYDLFRALRLAARHPNLLVQAEDALFWLAAALGMFYFLLRVNQGEVRAFSVIGALLGMTLYAGAVSPLVMRVFALLIAFIKRVLKAAFGVLLAPLQLCLKELKFLARAARARFLKPGKKLLCNSARCAKIKGRALRKNLRVIFKKV